MLFQQIEILETIISENETTIVTLRRLQQILLRTIVATVNFTACWYRNTGWELCRDTMAARNPRWLYFLLTVIYDLISVVYSGCKRFVQRRILHVSSFDNLHEIKDQSRYLTVWNSIDITISVSKFIHFILHFLGLKGYLYSILVSPIAGKQQGRTVSLSNAGYQPGETSELSLI